MKCHMPPLLLLLLGGCASSPSADAVQQINRGMTLEQLRQTQRASADDASDQFAPLLLHHATTADSANRKTLEVVSAELGAGMPFVFVFEDGSLTSIHDPNVKTVNALKTATTAMQVLADIGLCPTLSDQEMHAAIRARHEAASRQKASEDPLPMAGVLRLLDGADGRYDEYVRLMERFDATRLPLGSTIPQSDATFGPPASTIDRTDGTHLRAYGETREIEPFPNPRVFASFRDGRLCEVVTRYDVALEPAKARRTYE